METATIVQTTKRIIPVHSTDYSNDYFLDDDTYYGDGLVDDVSLVTGSNHLNVKVLIVHDSIVITVSRVMERLERAVIANNV